jgi:hypothetical protein
MHLRLAIFARATCLFLISSVYIPVATHGHSPSIDKSEMLTQEAFVHIFMLVIEVADGTLACYAYLLQSVEIHQQITHGWNEILPLIHITRL